MNTVGQQLTFTEEEIQRLFGDEAADFEAIDRLKQYYVKTEVYDQFKTELPLRILVGHKGIGKSALFRVAMSEDRDDERLAILIKPDDVAEIGGDTQNFLQLIRIWKQGLSELLAQKVLSSFGATGDDVGSRLKQWGGAILDLVYHSLKDTQVVSLDPAKKAVVQQFLRLKEL